jgi:hypothetical protein
MGAGFALSHKGRGSCVNALLRKENKIFFVYIPDANALFCNPLLPLFRDPQNQIKIVNLIF